MKRILEIDVMKGILIILMVWTHVIQVGSKFISSFNMPVFFMISGIFLKECNSFSNFFSLSIRKIKKLYLYYILTNLLFLVFHNFFVSVNFYTNNSAVLDYFSNTNLYSKYSFRDFVTRFVLILTTCGGTQLGGATWFFRVLLFSSLLYLFMNYIFSKVGFKRIDYIQLLVSFFLIVFTIFLSKKEFLVFEKNIFLWVNQVLLAYSMFPIGKLVYACIPYIFAKKSRRIICFFVSLVILLLPIEYNGAFSNGILNNPFVILSAISGFLFIYSISFFIVNNNVYITKFFSLLGENTVSIVCFHFFCFKLVNIILINVYHYPSYCIAGFPTAVNLLNKNSISYFLWCGIYLIVGIICPMILEIQYKNIKQKIGKI